MTIEQAIEVLDGRYLRMSMVADYEECLENNEAISMAIAALRAQQEQEAENEMLNEKPCKAMQWISVKDRLPDEGGSYIVHSGASGKVFTAHYWPRDRRWSGRGINLNVTHWMPLPAEPDTNKK